MQDPSNPACHPSRGQAQIAYDQALEALSRDREVREGHLAWLRCQEPVAIDVNDRVLLAYPSQAEARLARGSEAMV